MSAVVSAEIGLGEAVGLQHLLEGGVRQQDRNRRRIDHRLRNEGMDDIVHHRAKFPEPVALVIVHHQALLELDYRPFGLQSNPHRIQALRRAQRLWHMNVRLKLAILVDEHRNRPVSLDKTGDEGQVNGGARLGFLNDPVGLAHQVGLVPLFRPERGEEGIRVSDQFRPLDDGFRPQLHLPLLLRPERARDASARPQGQRHDGRRPQKEDNAGSLLVAEGHG